MPLIHRDELDFIDAAISYDVLMVAVSRMNVFMYKIVKETLWSRGDTQLLSILRWKVFYTSSHVFTQGAKKTREYVLLYIVVSHCLRTHIYFS